MKKRKGVTTKETVTKLTVVPFSVLLKLIGIPKGAKITYIQGSRSTGLCVEYKI